MKVSHVASASGSSACGASLCLSFEHAVRWSGLTDRVISGAIRSGELLVVRRGRRIFIVRDDLVRFLQRQCVPVPDPGRRSELPQTRKEEQIEQGDCGN